MRFRLPQLRISRWLVGLTLAMYATAGLFGHALHDVLPCVDETCAQHASAVGRHCWCHHNHEFGSQAGSQDDSHGSTATRPGHDPQHCSLCTLLAKIATGRVVLFTAELNVAPVDRQSPIDCLSTHRDFDFARAPRGPPLV
jgi:hypothetical protein